MSKEKKYHAHKESGGAACLFAGSVVIELIMRNNSYTRFPFPFYALTFDLIDNHFDEWVKDYEISSRDVLKYISKNGISYFEKNQQIIVKQRQKFEKYVKTLIPRLKVLDKDSLAFEYHLFLQSYLRAFSLGIVTFLYEARISDKLVKILVGKDPEIINHLPGLLENRYKSFFAESEEFLLKIKQEKNNKVKSELIKQYLDRFYFIDTNYERGNVLDKKKVLKMAAESVKTSKPQQLDKVSRIKLKNREKNIIELLKLTESIRDQRKYVNLLGSYTMFRFLDELVKKTEISMKLAKKLYWFEFNNALYNEKGLSSRLQKRKKATTLFYNNSTVYADRYIVHEQKVISPSQELSGTPVYPGVVQGKVKIVKGPRDFSKFKRGEVLVTQATRPDFVPIMRKAKAIVTDEGGIVSHAAIVAREFRIPCIVGTKTGSNQLKTGNIIEVDANKGKIRAK